MFLFKGYLLLPTDSHVYTYIHIYIYRSKIKFCINIIFALVKEKTLRKVNNNNKIVSEIALYICNYQFMQCVYNITPTQYKIIFPHSLVKYLIPHQVCMHLLFQASLLILLKFVFVLLVYTKGGSPHHPLDIASDARSA